MVINKWKIEAIVRRDPGLSLVEFATELGVCKPAALRHARKHKSLIVERGRRGKGYKTRLWLKWDPPVHLRPIPPVVEPPASDRRPDYLDLDEI